MRRTDEKYVVMFQTVSGVMGKNQGIWSATPAVVTSVDLFQSEVELMQEKAVAQTRPITGVTEAKGDLRGDLEDVLLEMADALGALADAQEDRVLEASVDFTPSGLGRMSGEALDREATSVLRLARERLAELAAHNVTEADLTALADAQKAFDTIKTQPRQSIAGRSAETATLPERVRAMKKFLRDRLDRQVRRFRRTQPEFYAAYRSARVVLGPKGHGSGEDEASAPGETPPPAA